MLCTCYVGAINVQGGHSTKAQRLTLDLLEWNLEENLTQSSFTKLCEILRENFEDELGSTNFPTSFQQAIAMHGTFDMPYKRVDMCVKGCCLFEGDLENANRCPTCKESRWEELGTEEEKAGAQTTKKPRLQFFWWPLKTIFRRLFQIPELAELMRSHGLHTPPSTGRKDTIWGKYYCHSMRVSHT